MTDQRHVLIVDDEESICWALQQLLTGEGHSVAVASTAEAALAQIGRRKPDLMVLDVRLPGMDGLTAIPRLQAVAGPLPIVVMTAFGDLDTAVKAMSCGVVDYLTKPFELEQIAAVLRRALQSPHNLPAEPTALVTGGEELLGAGPAMQEVFKRIAIVARSDVSVLITGESGTGKELVAKAIQRHSLRADKPFVPVNLASLSPSLVESELFGHARGAFTGAEAARTGLLMLAHQATVFLDEVADIPLHVQVKLLRVLEQQELTPVGESHPKFVEFRVIAATSRDLGKLMRENAFREDLFFRLAGFEIHLPPLRQRRGDICLLAERFLRSGRVPHQPGCHFTEEAIQELQSRPWPGNVRELRNAVEHAALVSRGGPIGPEHLPPARALDAADRPPELSQFVRHWASGQLSSGEPIQDLYDRLLAEIEPPLLDVVLQATSQNRAAAADILGIHRQTLRKKLDDKSDGEK